MALNLQINSVYSFQTYAPAILGAIIRNAKLEASLNFEAAMKLENVDATYRAVFPALPQGTPASPAGQIFHRFVSESGQKIFIAEPWIVGSTVVTVTNLSFTISIVNATSNDKANIQRALSFLNVNFSINDN